MNLWTARDVREFQVNLTAELTEEQLVAQRMCAEFDSAMQKVHRKLQEILSGEQISPLYYQPPDEKNLEHIIPKPDTFTHFEICSWRVEDRDASIRINLIWDNVRCQPSTFLVWRGYQERKNIRPCMKDLVKALDKLLGLKGQLKAKCQPVVGTIIPLD